MAGRKRTEADYQHLLEAFREHGKNFKRVAKVSGFDRATVTRAYEVGWGALGEAIGARLERDHVITRGLRLDVLAEGPELPADVVQEVFAQPLADVQEGAESAARMLALAAARAKDLEGRAKVMLAEAQRKMEEVERFSQEKVAVAEEHAKRAIAQAEMDAKQHLANFLVKAKVDAAETMADEANSVKMGRKAVLSLTAIVALVMRDVQVIAERLRSAMEGLNKMSPQQAIRTLADMTRLVESAERAVILSLQAERLRVGQPTDVIGITSIDASLEEREIKLKALTRTLEKAKAKAAAQGLTLLPGGAAGAPGAA